MSTTKKVALVVLLALAGAAMYITNAISQPTGPSGGIIPTRIPPVPVSTAKPTYTGNTPPTWTVAPVPIGTAVPTRPVPVPVGTVGK